MHRNFSFACGKNPPSCEGVTALLNRITIAVGCALALTACKPKEASQPPTLSAETQSASTPVDTKVVQEADPPELAQARQFYMTGAYKQVITLLDPLLSQWQSPSRQRTRALAQAWIGLAHVEDVPENALSYVEQA